MELSNAQKQVINTKNKSLLVSASAGSGKTFVVIQRIIESIKQGRDVSRLLVLTFTNAAASELKERLITSLYALKDEYLAQGDRTNAVRIAKQISKVPMADISTIHAFCLNIIRNNFYSLGIDPNITTLDQAQATILLNDVINEVVENEYELKEEAFLDVLDILGGEVNLINTIYMLFMAYNSVLKKDEWLDTTLSNYSTDENLDLSYTEFGKIILSSIKNRLNILKLELENTIENLDGLEDFLSRQEMLKYILNNINLALNTNTYDELYNIMPILQDSPRLPSNKVIDEELKEEIKALKTRVTDEIKDIAKVIYKDSKGIIKELHEVYKYISWYTRIVKLVEEKYTLAKKEKCSIDFSDYEHLAFKALQDENVKNKYKEKYEEIYIDEYQDTSYAQEAILQMISREDNTIMVGDVKQSIYAFRHAKPELFSSKYELLKDVSEADDLNKAKIILAENFRSRKEVLYTTNEIFTNLMSKDFGGARYEDKEALVYGADYDYSLEQNYKTEIHVIEKNIEDKEPVKEETLTSIETEAVLVAQRIKELIDNKFKIYDLKKKEYRDAKYKDIVILLKSVEGKADIVSKVLSSYNIPCFADSKTGFYSSEEISLVIAFLKVLDNPLEDISLVSVMYSIIGKFTLDELALVRNKNMASSVLNSLKDAKETIEDESLKNKIISFLSLLERYKAYLRTYKISDLLIKLYSETGLYEALRIEKLGELKCANLDNFINIIASYEKSADRVSLHSILKYLKVLKAKESSGDSPKIIGENEDVVRIMTIHKSKGLEFPIVILMNSAARYNEQDTSDKLQFDDELGLGIDILNKDLGIMYPSIIKQAIKAKTRKTLRAEALRLLYVAFTRAKEKLIVYGAIPSLDKYISKLIKVRNKESSEFIASGYNSHLQCILQAAIDSDKNFELVLHGIEDVTQDNIEEKTLNRNEDRTIALMKAVKKYGLKKDDNKIKALKETLNCEYTPFNTNKKYTVTELKQSETFMQDLKPSVLTSKVTGTSYGTFMHAVIERLNYIRVTKEEILKTVENVANELGMSESINKIWVTNEIFKMYEVLKEYLEGAISVKNELEFVIYDDLKSVEEVTLETPSLIQGVVDMLIVTKENKHIIIDFKTDKVQNAEELMDKYKVQLKIYKKGIELNINKKVDSTFIYSFSLSKLIEVE